MNSNLACLTPVVENLSLRIALNASWTVVSACIAITVLYYLVPRLWEPGWYMTRANKAAIGLVFYYSGSAVARSWSIAFLMYPELARFTPWGIGGSLMALVGGLCILRIFSPANWGNWGWFITFILAGAAFIFMEYAIYTAAPPSESEPTTVGVLEF